MSKGILYGIRPDQIPPKCWGWSNLIYTLFTLHPYTLIPLQVLRELESPRKVTESSGLSMDGENSSDTSVVPTLEDRTEPRWGLDTSTLLNTDTTLRHYTPTLHSNTRPNSPLQGPGRLQFAGGQGCLS